MGVLPLDLVRQAADVLRERAGLPNARLEAERMLAHALGLNRLDLYLQFERPVREAELERFREMVRRRLRREPLQYILGEAAFRELVLKVDRRVLIPRPETEVLVGEVLKHRAGRPGGRALDVGTGSGAIALSLAHEGTFEQVVATDASPAALEVARANAARLGLEGRVEFRLGETWAAVGPEERFDVVASNPPYVAEGDRATLMPEIREWEPAVALYAGPHGLAVLEQLVAGGADRLNPGGLLALEVGIDQAETVAGQARTHGGYGEVRIVADLTGRPRIVLAIRN